MFCSFYISTTLQRTKMHIKVSLFLWLQVGTNAFPSVPQLLGNPHNPRTSMPFL